MTAKPSQTHSKDCQTDRQMAATFERHLQFRQR